MIEVKKLDSSNLELYLEYLKKAFEEEPEMMVGEFFDPEGIRNRINDPFYQRTTSLLAIENNKVLGRLEYHFYGCMQDGHRMCYVDWVYVLPEYRHNGVARLLFSKLEEDCKLNNMNQYYLIRSENELANSFYSNFTNVTLDEEPILRKEL